MVEFVIVLPFMLFLIFMIVYAGIGFERYSRVTNAARVAARAAAVARFDGNDPCVAAEDAANSRCTASALRAADVRPAGCAAGIAHHDHPQYQLPNIPMISSLTGPITVTGKATERME